MFNKSFPHNEKSVPAAGISTSKYICSIIAVIETTIEKLEKFIQEEKARAHQVAEGINRKMIEAEKRRENLVEMKKQLKSDIKKRNQEMAAKAGKKAEDMKQGDMADYEAK